MAPVIPLLSSLFLPYPLSFLDPHPYSSASREESAPSCGWQQGCLCGAGLWGQKGSGLGGREAGASQGARGERSFRAAQAEAPESVDATGQE